MSKSLCKRQKRRHREEEGHVMTEAEIGVMQPQAKEHHQKLEEARRVLPQGLQRDSDLANTMLSDFWSPEL